MLLPPLQPSDAMSELSNILYNTFNPSKHTFGKPYASTSGLSGKEQTIFFIIALIIGVYVGLRLWWSLRNDKKKK